MIREMTTARLDADCRTCVALKSRDMSWAKALLTCRYSREEAENFIRVYDSGVTVSGIRAVRIGLEEYYIHLMNERGTLTWTGQSSLRRTPLAGS